MALKESIALFERLVAEEFAKLEFKKRQRTLFTRVLTADTLGWIGLNRATSPAEGLVDVNPVIGLRHQPTERLLARLLGQKPHEYIPPTVSTPLRYLAPESERCFWKFSADQDLRSTLQDVMTAVGGYGIPFMLRNTSPHQLVALMETSGFGIPQQIALRLPVMYCLMGQFELAEQHLLRQLEKLTGAGAERFERFAQALRRQMKQPGAT